MKQNLFATLKFLIFLLIGGALVWLALKGLTEEDKIQIAKSLKEANYFWVGLSIVAGLIAHFSRAVRWKMLLEPLGLNPKLSNTFHAVMIGYVGNLAFPRLGEVLRCGILKRYENIPLTQSFGTVIAERIIDILVMLLLFIISAWIEYERLKNYILEKILEPLSAKLLGLMENTFMFLTLLIITAGALAALYFFRKKIFENKVVKKIAVVLGSFMDGIKSVSKVKSQWWFAFHSLFIWFMYLMSVYVCIFAFTETQSMSLADCLVIMCFGSLGVIASPGGIGAYQWIVLQIMLLWGYTTAIGVAFGWVAWLAQTAAVLVFGLISFGLLAIGNKEKEFES